MAKNLIVISDTHFGDRVSLCRNRVKLDGGGEYVASTFQTKLGKLWDDFWAKWVPMVTRDEPYDILHNGDVLEGVHHGATHQISQNIQDQVNLSTDMLGEIIRMPKVERYFQIRGTPAHVGESGWYEENIAKQLGAVPNEEGQHARFRIRMRVGKALVHAMHHIGTTSSSAHEASAVNAELTAEFVEAARHRQDPPDFVVRSHRHRCIAVDLDSAHGYAAGIVTPAWQGKTPFTYKIPGARISIPQFGGILIRQGDEEFYYRRKVWFVEPDTIVEDNIEETNDHQSKRMGQRRSRK